jgi:hypothetical protein
MLNFSKTAFWMVVKPLTYFRNHYREGRGEEVCFFKETVDYEV